MSVETRRSQDAFLYDSEIAKPELANCSSTRSADGDYASWQQLQEEATNLACTGTAAAIAGAKRATQTREADVRNHIVYKAIQLQHLSTK
jgi:hypothetical protein